MNNMVFWVLMPLSLENTDVSGEHITSIFGVED
jgi:hypothetical protein